MRARALIAVPALVAVASSLLLAAGPAALGGALGLLGVLAAMIGRGRGGVPWRVRRTVDDRGGEAAVSSSQPPSPR
jgi:uncharacterized protein (DUF58 family)